MTPMTPEEARAFLLHGTRTGNLATVRADGRPHVAPIWFTLDGNDLVFNTGRDSVKGRNMARDPRVMLRWTTRPRRSRSCSSRARR